MGVGEEEGEERDDTGEEEGVSKGEEEWAGGRVCGGTGWPAWERSQEEEAVVAAAFRALTVAGETITSHKASPPALAATIPCL